MSTSRPHSNARRAPRRGLALALLALLLGAAAPRALAQTPDFTWTGVRAGDDTGRCVTIVGDMDDDGWDDVAYGAPLADRPVGFPATWLPDRGLVMVRSGRTGAVIHSWYGSQEGALFGAAVADAGRVDGDNVNDLLIGIPLASNALGFEGAVQVRSGATGALIRTHYGQQRFSRFGATLAGGGDFDWGSRDDYAVGAPWFDADDSLGGSNEEGRVYLFSGEDGLLWANPTGGPTLLPPNLPGVQNYQVEVRGLGTSLAVSGQHLVAGAPDSDLRDLDTGGLTLDTGYVLSWRVLFGNQAHRAPLMSGARSGSAVGLGNVVPGDDPEVAVGEPGVGAGGRVLVLQPTYEFPLAWNPVSLIEGTSVVPLGEVLAFGLDADTDGLDDLVLGSPTSNIGAPFGIASAGVARVYAAATGALINQFNGSSPGEQLGTSVALGRVSGSLLGDVLLGVPGLDTSTANVGGVHQVPARDCASSLSSYGVGLAGTFGTPQLSLTGEPLQGLPVGLALTNTSGGPTTAWLFLGASPASIPVKGGTLLLAPFKILSVPMSGAALTLFPELPIDASLCNVSLYLQGLVVDPGAPNGVAFSKALEFQVGF